MLIFYLRELGILIFVGIFTFIEGSVDFSRSASNFFSLIMSFSLSETFNLILPLCEPKL